MSLMNALDQAAGRRLRWQQEGAGGGLMAPTVLCARLPDMRARDALEEACHQACITTRRWYLPLLQHMPALAPLCEILDPPVAHGLAQTLLGLPFFPKMSSAQCVRVVSQVQAVFDMGSSVSPNWVEKTVEAS